MSGFDLFRQIQRLPDEDETPLVFSLCAPKKSTA
jgi:hypothetical protein